MFNSFYVIPNKVMKFIVSLLFTFNVALCHAQKSSQPLRASDYTYIEFTTNLDGKQYPLVFATATEQDTITVNLTNIQLFINSVYASCPYVPITNNAYEKCYGLVFGHSEDTFSNCQSFINEFNMAFKQLEQKGYITLLTGEKIHYACFRIRGAFLETNKETFWKETLSSIGISDSSSIHKIIVPIAISNYKKRSVFFIQ
jgi:hypothetical protein